MAIWSLTKERVEKLLKQIGDRQLEIDELIKLSKEDLWTRDLDDFLHEWEYQLEDDKSTRKRIQGMKRRVSAKLKTQNKPGRKRKGDDDDSDFDTKKPTKKTKPIAGGLLDYLGPPSKEAAKKAADTKPRPKAQAKAKDEDVWMNIDGSSDIDVAAVAASSKPQTVATKPPAAAAPGSSDVEEDVVRPRARAAARKPVNYGGLSDSSLDSDGDFDVGMMVKGIGENSTSTAPSRPLFAASSTSRPGSSHGLAARKSFTTLSARPSLAAVGEDLSADETDYTRLAPATNGPKATTAKAAIALSDDEDYDISGTMDIDAPKPVAAPKPAPAASATAAAAGAKKKGRPAGGVNKAKPSKADTKKTESKPAGEKKQLTLSPAAKAYAAKQKAALAGGKVDGRSKKKDIFSDDEDVFVDAVEKSNIEAERLADEMLLSDDDEEEGDDEPIVPVKASKGKGSAKVAAPKSKPKPKGKEKEKEKARPARGEKKGKQAVALDVDAVEDYVEADIDEEPVLSRPAAGGGRPARRAAAVKKNWVVDDDDGESEVNEGWDESESEGFEDDDDDDD